METSKRNTNENSFLKKGSKGDITSYHKEYLGTDIPKDYFQTSKLSILDKIKEEQQVVKQPKQKVIWLQPSFRYAVAASLLLLFSVSIWLQNMSLTDYNEIDVELLSFNDDVLLDALLVDDNQLNNFAEATLINEVVIKAELSEQRLDNLILDSMILEDSLLDDYLGDELIENIIL